jgi:DNA-binding beta-propeller fold protein YncE
VYITDTGTSGPGTVRAYQPAGDELVLTHPLSDASYYYNHVTWDSQHDRFFIARQAVSGSANSVIAVNPDGSLVAPQPTFAFAAGEYITSMTYDPKFSQLYLGVSPGGVADGEIRKYNTSGAQVGNPLYIPYYVAGVAYDPATDLLYVSRLTGTATVHAYRPNQTIAVETNEANHVFAGLKSAPDIAFDGHHGLLYVAECACNTSVAGFSAFNATTGARVGTVVSGGDPQSIAYDPVHEHILLADHSNAIILVYEANAPDFPLVDIVNGQFSGLAGPTGIAYRP